MLNIFLKLMCQQLWLTCLYSLVLYLLSHRSSVQISGTDRTGNHNNDGVCAHNMQKELLKE